jgi:hypothetical protein
MLTAQVAREYAPEDAVYLYMDLHSSVVQFLDKDLSMTAFDDRQTFPVKPPPDKDAVFLLSPGQPGDKLRQDLLEAYPHATVKDFKDRDGQVCLWAIQVPRGDFQP